MTTAADLQAARADFAVWQRTDEEAAHDRDPRRVRVMRIVAAERVRLIEQRLAIGSPSGAAPGQSLPTPAGPSAEPTRAQRRDGATLEAA